MLNLKRIIELLLQVLAELDWTPSSGDVIDEIANGGLLTVAQSATIGENSDETIYRWIEDAASKGLTLGWRSATWLIGTARVLDYVEKHQGGLPARVKAENLLKRYWPIWSQPRKLRRGE
ncbi:hypothetical protein IVA96_30380 [Bradyrhizobium sp. 159]|uniref:hypothetical protein n=1 Tax=Bradyrhizobium sp. 159 TaxID=2782632 RepID=UPI001FF70A95|nr:hypothetical protein [Bradyrhizobium sp. 159]MCK1620803.1 hypothetical protein [Bradyrhizobium sp. 159]